MVRLASAIEWSQENPTEKVVTAGRIFDVKPQSIRIALKRTKRKDQKAHGGNNKILSDIQSEAVQAYCREQYEAGLGATKQMVFAAISHLSQEQSPRKPPSWRWLQTWLKANLPFHTITTKPIARNRVDTHDEKDVEEWFDKYRATLAKYGIKREKNST